MSNESLVEDCVKKFQRQASLKAIIQPSKTTLDELVREAVALSAANGGGDDFDLLKKIRGRIKVLAVAARTQPEASYFDSVIRRLDLVIGSH